MNQSKFVKVYESLVKVLGSKEATKIALRVSKEKAPAPSPKGTKPASNGGSLKSRIIAFADKRRGAVWSLQNCARQLGVNPDHISPQLTILCSEGYLVRTGRGEYRRTH